MIYFHGTTRRRAERICVEGFQPRKPSRRVWFARSKHYALQRARTKARRAHDRPVVLTCELDLNALRRASGRKHAVHGSGGIIAIDGCLPVSVLRSHTADDALPTSPDELKRWLCGLLNLKIWKGPGRNHPGIDRLSRWIVNRLSSEPKRPIRKVELVELARQWLPEYFEGFRLDPQTPGSRRQSDDVQVTIETAAEEDTDPREQEALRCLSDPSARRRTRGLRLLAELDVPDLFDWCAMFLEDESESVGTAAIEVIANRCEDVDPATIEPFIATQNIHLRAAAICALRCHGAEDASRWFERGLKDPSTHVRLQTAALLDRMDPTTQRHIFELALTDLNPDIVKKASRLTAHKHYSAIRW